MKFLLTIILSVILQIFLLRIFANRLAKEMEFFEDRIDEKLNLHDKLNRLERNLKKESAK